MSEEKDPHYLKKHPEVFKKMCHDLIKDISTAFCNDIPPRLKNIYYEVLPRMEKSINSSINEIWSELNLDNKAADLIALIENTKTDELQWRLKTGEVDISHEKLCYIIMMKNRSLKLVEAKKKEIEALENAITEKRNEMDEQMVEITKVLNEMNYPSKTGNQNKVVGLKKK